MLIDYTLRKATFFIPYDIFTNTYRGRRINGRRRTDDDIRYFKKKQPSETKYNKGYNSRLEVRVGRKTLRN